MPLPLTVFSLCSQRNGTRKAHHSKVQQQASKCRSPDWRPHECGTYSMKMVWSCKTCLNKPHHSHNSSVLQKSCFLSFTQPVEEATLQTGADYLKVHEKWISVAAPSGSTQQYTPALPGQIRTSGHIKLVRKWLTERNSTEAFFFHVLYRRCSISKDTGMQKTAVIEFGNDSSLD